MDVVNDYAILRMPGDIGDDQASVLADGHTPVSLVEDDRSPSTSRIGCAPRSVFLSAGRRRRRWKTWQF